MFVVVVAKLVFMRLKNYKSDNWQSIIIMHSSCNVHDEYICSSTGVLQEGEVVCRSLHKLGT